MLDDPRERFAHRVHMVLIAAHGPHRRNRSRCFRGVVLLGAAVSTAADRRKAYAWCAEALAMRLMTVHAPASAAGWLGQVQRIHDALLAASRVEDAPGVEQLPNGNGKVGP